MKIAVFGANGQLGKKIKDLESYYKQYEFSFTDVDQVDITSKASLDAYLSSFKADVLINCAAYTAVDKAESEPELADKINHLAVKNLALSALETKAYLVHVSTDYVFDGESYRPYTEQDIPSPVSQYGISKLKGEEAFLQIGAKGIIVRTSWLYSEYGNNFVKTMLRLGKEKESLGVVSDQIGTPTYAGDLAEAILQIVAHLHRLSKIEIYHYSNQGVCSWYDFSYRIMQMASLPCVIQPIASSQYPTLAHRPFYSVLDKTKIKEHFSIQIPYWQDSLSKVIPLLQR